jgi:rubrerythrin
LNITLAVPESRSTAISNPDDYDKPNKRYPQMADEYGCVDCEHTWYGEEMDCPVCGSTRTGLIVPAPEEIH